ncbi:Protein Classification HAMP domain-containing histidine kinase [Ktedonobacteria bacterium brp13]|nr:Protein Classification HAMP domain-containing histidine kinase [Ktedonobacteria bacterium brp13]
MGLSLNSESERIGYPPASISLASPILFDGVLEAMEMSVILFDRYGKICYMNSSALRLFHMQPGIAYRNITYLYIFKQYRWHDEEDHPLSLAQLPFSLLWQQTTSPHHLSRTVVLSHAEYKQSFQFNCSLVFDSHQQISSILCTFETRPEVPQKSWQVYKTYQAITSLIQATLHLPQLLDISFEREELPLPERIGFFAQYLVDLIRQVLEYDQVLLLSIGPEPTRYIYYIAISGLSTEQKQRRIEISGHISLDHFFDAATIELLFQNKFCIIEHSRVSLPFTSLPDFSPQTEMLEVPIFFGIQLVGVLVCAKNKPCSHYSSEEISLTRTITELLTLILVNIRSLKDSEKPQAKTLLAKEIDHLIESFLNSVSHEFKTPLTVIMGNVQLAMRRIKAIQRTIAEQPEKANQHMENVQALLEQATQGVSALNLLLDTIIDDIQVQRGLLTLNKSRFDLFALLQEVIEKQQKQHPENTIQFRTTPPIATLFIMADRECVERAATTYIINALLHTPHDSPVVVQVEQPHEKVRVLVSDKGPVIADMEKKDVWERFTRPRVVSPVHESDWSLGLGLYLCQALIQRHRGQVGFESTPEHGTTFWFELPTTQDEPEQSSE